LSLLTFCIFRFRGENAITNKFGSRRKKNMKNKNYFERRPWGSFTILDESDTFKVKRIEVLPKARLSYQKHARRTEHWFVVAGRAKVTLNGAEILRKEGEAIDIPLGAAHRVENPSMSETLVFIEVQRGDYFGEDDIVRLQDDYERN
jgi:mannose-6-phosphate isomerase